MEQEALTNLQEAWDSSEQKDECIVCLQELRQQEQEEGRGWFPAHQSDSFQYSESCEAAAAAAAVCVWGGMEDMCYERLRAEAYARAHNAARPAPVPVLQARRAAPPPAPEAPCAGATAVEAGPAGLHASPGVGPPSPSTPPCSPSTPCLGDGCR